VRLSAGRAIDAGGFQFLREIRAQQQVVDAQAGVAFEGIPPVFPEGIDALLRMFLADRVGPALRDERRR
jgi:hypothetical protein